MTRFGGFWYFVVVSWLCFVVFSDADLWGLVA